MQFSCPSKLRMHITTTLELENLDCNNYLCYSCLWATLTVVECEQIQIFFLESDLFALTSHSSLYVIRIRHQCEQICTMTPYL